MGRVWVRHAGREGSVEEGCGGVTGTGEEGGAVKSKCSYNSTEYRCTG